MPLPCPCPMRVHYTTYEYDFQDPNTRQEREEENRKARYGGRRHFNVPPPPTPPAPPGKRELKAHEMYVKVYKENPVEEWSRIGLMGKLLAPKLVPDPETEEIIVPKTEIICDALLPPTKDPYLDYEPGLPKPFVMCYGKPFLDRYQAAGVCGSGLPTPHYEAYGYSDSELRLASRRDEEMRTRKPQTLKDVEVHIDFPNKPFDRYEFFNSV